MVLEGPLPRESCSSGPRMREAPTTRAVNGEPGMCWSACLMAIVYSPGAIGTYWQLHVPRITFDSSI